MTQKINLLTDETGILRAIELKDGVTAFSVLDRGVSAVFNGKEYTDPSLFEVVWTPLGDCFEKTVVFRAPEDGVLESVSVLDLSFPEMIELHYHDDKTIWHVPMSVFVRYPEYSVFYGLEYPYWDDTAKMAFSPWLPMKAGETLACEKAFLGVCRRSGKEISSHGPYPGKRKQKYHDMFSPEKGGLPQHVPDGVIPDDMGIPEEQLDTGEIRAMRDFLALHIGHYPLPEEGYFVWQNGWWAGLFLTDKDCIDVMSRSGIHDILTAMMYYGYDSHPNCFPNYIREVRFDPLRFPAVTDEMIQIGEQKAMRSQKNRDKGEMILHHEVECDETVRTSGETAGFVPPPKYEKLIRIGEECGVHVASFSTPNNSYSAYPEWHALKENGTPYDYFGSPLSCPACKEYMERHFQMIESVLQETRPRLWSFDGRWMGYREFDLGEAIGEQPCWSESHGHLPGKSRYIEWKNIIEFKRRLRERFPDLVMEHYYGMKRGGTWSLLYFNSDENVFECSCADDNRFQTWHNENDRFRPTYLNYAPIFGAGEELEYSMISAISTAEYAQTASAYHALKNDPKSLEIFRKWKDWAGKNIRYLRDRDTLFGCPGDVSIDGSSHILDGEGWVFLFNTVDFDDIAALSLSEIPGLKGKNYEADVIYPETTRLLPEGDIVSVPVRAHSACVLWLGKKD
ncbi:MAG: hypothetical protein J5938_01940 [Clostridia bacterium]|nr:hypothetical protein [Clostridia bacterium]